MQVTNIKYKSLNIDRTASRRRNVFKKINGWIVDVVTTTFLTLAAGFLIWSAILA